MKWSRRTLTLWTSRLPPPSAFGPEASTAGSILGITWESNVGSASERGIRSGLDMAPEWVDVTRTHGKDGLIPIPKPCVASRQI
jgi:hypothetical protein